MSREDDDTYFENFSVFNEESRPAPRVQAPPLVSVNRQPTPAAIPRTDDDYFRNLSVFDQGQAYESDTVRIPQDIIKQLEAGIIPGQQQAEPVPTKVEYRNNYISRVSGSLIEPQSGAGPNPRNHGGGWHR